MDERAEPQPRDQREPHPEDDDARDSRRERGGDEAVPAPGDAGSGELFAQQGQETLRGPLNVSIDPEDRSSESP